LTPEDQLEIESDRRRRVNAAFRLGTEATAATVGPPWFGPLAAGVAIAVAIALVMGVIALARAAPLSSGSSTPGVTSSPSR
jgi:hypothetical protein